MAVLGDTNTADSPVQGGDALTFDISSAREEFQKWLQRGKNKKFSSEVIIACIDKVSKYVIRKKMSPLSLWEITHPSIFNSIYNKLAASPLLRIYNSSVYELFSAAGHLYFCFLRDKESSCIAIAHNESEDVYPISEEESQQEEIDANDVVAWLITQKNAKGTLYLENVVKTYMSALRSAPKQLVLPDSVNRNVFACRTVAVLDELWDIFKCAPNYIDVNRTPWHGQLSAGLAVYRRYLEHIGKIADKQSDEQAATGGGVPVRDSSPPSVVVAHAVDTVSPPGSAVMFDPTLIRRVTTVLVEHFSNGYRLNSPIEMLRFRSFSSNDMDDILSLSDDNIKAYITACGTNFEGKVYVVSLATKNEIQELAERYFAGGAQVIFFSEFYAKHEGWLFEARIISEDMLVVILHELFPRLLFTRTYFGYIDAPVGVAVEREILRVWHGDVLCTYSQISARLPYIPLERIKYTLGQNSKFIWNSAETFSHINQIKILRRERKAIRTAAAQACNTCGYVSMTDLPFEAIAERNYTLSTAGIHNAIFQRCLADVFDKKGKIITCKGAHIDALRIMQEHCKTLERCSLDALLDFEKELTGEVHRWIPMKAANSVLVRVDADAYVADTLVHFDVQSIDKAIHNVIKGDYLPLRGFTLFGTFPDCGQTWNLFLLESYCRRFSRTFRFDTLSVNSRNVGAVIRQSCHMHYTELMADAVLHADIPLTQAAVGCFLFDNGYIGRRRPAKIAEVIEKAKGQRERMD